MRGPVAWTRSENHPISPPLGTGSSRPTRRILPRAQQLSPRVQLQTFRPSFPYYRPSAKKRRNISSYFIFFISCMRAWGCVIRILLVISYSNFCLQCSLLMSHISRTRLHNGRLLPQNASKICVCVINMRVDRVSYPGVFTGQTVSNLWPFSRRGPGK